MLKRARLLLCIPRAVLSVVLGAWSVRLVGWADWVDCRCFLSFVFLGVVRRLELSPCNTAVCDSQRKLDTVDTAQATLYCIPALVTALVTWPSFHAVPGHVQQTLDAPTHHPADDAVTSFHARFC